MRSTAAPAAGHDSGSADGLARSQVSSAVLTGWSFGSCLAQQCAALLQSSNLDVAAVLLLDDRLKLPIPVAYELRSRERVSSVLIRELIHRMTRETMVQDTQS